MIIMPEQLSEQFLRDTLDVSLRNIENEGGSLGRWDLGTHAKDRIVRGMLSSGLNDNKARLSLFSKLIADEQYALDMKDLSDDRKAAAASNGIKNVELKSSKPWWGNSV